MHLSTQLSTVFNIRSKAQQAMERYYRRKYEKRMKDKSRSEARRWKSVARQAAVAAAMMIVAGLPLAANASTTYAQYTNLTNSSLNGGLMEMCLGTGLTGPFPTSMTAYVANSPNSGDSLWYRILDLGTTPCGVLPTAPSTPWNGNDQYTLSETAGSGALGLQTLTTVLVDNIGSTFNPTHYYVLRLQDANGHNMTYGGSSFQVCNLPQAGDGGTADSSLYNIFFQFDTTSSYTAGTGCPGFITPVLFTQITMLNPVGGSLISTSTSSTIGLSWYLDSSDFASSTQVQFQIQSYGCTVNGTAVILVVDYPCAATPTYTIDATTSGASGFSTTTSVITEAGGYYFTASIVKPLWTVFGFDIGTQTIVATTSSFTAATSTLLDSLVSTSQQFVSALSSTTATVANSCNPVDYSDFNFQVCVGSLFIPTPNLTAATLGTAQGDVQSVPLFGYIGDLITMSGDTSATTSLPSLVINLPSQYPDFGTTINLTPWNELLGSGSILATATSTGSDPQTIEQIVSPGWTLFVYIIGTVIIFREVMGIGGKVITDF